MPKNTGTTVQKDEDPPPDGDDSLIALHALLQIRGNAGQRGLLNKVETATREEPPKVSMEPRKSSEPTPPSNANQNNQTTGRRNQNGVSNMFRLTTTQPTIPPSFALSAAQMAAFASIQNAAALGMLQATNPSFLPPNQQMNTATLNVSTTTTDVKTNIQPLLGSSSSRQEQGGTVEKRSENSASSSRMETFGSKENLLPLAKKTGISTEAVAIRQDEVEAALRSKPQRGRKRENLNVMERLELTRTRNREHAKTTRVRKKARYQELLGKEELLVEMCEQEEKIGKRRRDILSFISAREQMLHLLPNDDDPRPNEILRGNTTAPVMEGEGNRTARFRCVSECTTPPHPNEHEQVDIDDKDVGVRLTSTNSANNIAEEFLSGIVGDLRSFSFQTSLAASRSHERSTPSDAVANMKKIDETLGACIARCSSGGTVSQLCYKVVGSADGIAMNKGGLCGFTKVDLVKKKEQNDETARVFVSAILTFQFDPENDKLSSVNWSIVQDSIGLALAYSSIPLGYCIDDSLTSQKNYPSVVSLEPASVLGELGSPLRPVRSSTGTDETIQERESNRGMNICE